MTVSGFIDHRRLRYGSWHAFERDVARLLVANGYSDVRLVGGPGDRGADILGVVRDELWVFQCKHTTRSAPSARAVQEVVEAGEYYGGSRLIVATSRPPGSGMLDEAARYRRLGLTVDIYSPRSLLELMARTPEFPTQRRNPYDYQEQAVREFREALLDTSRAQVVMATGLGKTVVMAELVSDLLQDGLVPHGRVLVLAHTVPLVNQLHQSFWYQLPKWVPTNQLADGEQPTSWDGITFATFQTTVNRIADLPAFGLVLVDEAHHVGAASYLDVITTLAPRMLGGVTATPWRGDGFDINDLLGPPVVQLGVEEGLRRGFLSEVEYRLLADNIDWNMIQKRSKHKYSLSQLNRQLIIPTRDDEAARNIRQAFDREARRSGIVFSPTIAHARSIAATLRTYGFRAESIEGSMGNRERDRLMTRFKRGELDLLTVVDLFNEGVDVPDVDLIVFMRATHSRRIFVQQLGRGLRVAPEKDKVLVLDFVTDLRRVAEILELERAVPRAGIERLGLGGRVIQFRDESAGSFLREWVLDQASLMLREGDVKLELPEMDFPQPLPPGGVA